MSCRPRKGSRELSHIHMSAMMGTPTILQGFNTKLEELVYLVQDLSLAVESGQEPKSAVYGNRSRDLTGQSFNSLTVVKRIGSKNKKALWLCECECGNTTEVITGNLTLGRIKTCGCSRNTDMVGRKLGMLTVTERTKIVDGMSYWLSKCECGKECELPWSHLRSRKSCGCLAGEFHGLRDSPVYGVWFAMKHRCLNKDNPNYKNYGGRGITVCDEWKDSITVFHEWAMSSGYQQGLTIDRINVNGNYEPSNCRWATWVEQANNKQIHAKEDSQ